MPNLFFTQDATALDAGLRALRPHIPAVEEISANNKVPRTSHEYFLHTTLRPILKLHHDALVSICAVFMEKHRSAFLQKSRGDQEIFITTMLKKDTALRSLVVGLCVGHFTSEERTFYLHSDNTAELNKRIIELAAKRFCDAIESIIRLI